MLLLPVQQPPISAVPPLHKARSNSMAPRQAQSLLWVNKDASNLHSKKHVAEVNAHVQKQSSRSRVTKKVTVKPTKLSALAAERLSPELARLSAHSRRRSSVQTLSPPPGDVNFYSTQSARRSMSEAPRSPPECITDAAELEISQSLASLDSATSVLQDPSQYDSRSLTFISEMIHAEDHLASCMPTSQDMANLMPGFSEGFSRHDKKLLHAYLTYVPKAFYGLDGRPAYCPVRTASLSNIRSDPLGLLWVFISIDMFLAKVRGVNQNDSVILQRKSRAYQLMAQRLDNPHDSQSIGFIIGTASAALAELYFGDQAQAIIHLGAVEAIINARGGIGALSDLPATVAIPMLNAFAYRTMIRDGLATYDLFQKASKTFIDTIRALLAEDKRKRDSRYERSSPGLYGLLDSAEATAQFKQTKSRVFAPGRLLRKFVHPEMTYAKKSDKIDHFEVLYNLNVALYDCGHDMHKASGFLDRFAEDLATASTMGGSSSALKISSVRCLLMSRMAKEFEQRHHSEGWMVRAWQSLDSLEIMKLLSPGSTALVLGTLSGMLTGDFSQVMTTEDIESLEFEASSNWWGKGSPSGSPHCDF